MCIAGIWSSYKNIMQSFKVIKDCEEVTVNVGELTQTIKQLAYKFLFDSDIFVILGNSMILEGLVRDLWL